MNEPLQKKRTDAGLWVRAVNLLCLLWIASLDWLLLLAYRRSRPIPKVAMTKNVTGLMLRGSLVDASPCLKVMALRRSH